MIMNKPLICVSNTSDALSGANDALNKLLSAAGMATPGNFDGTGGSSRPTGQRKIISPSAYLRAIDLAGGVPLLTAECCVEEMAELCDGLLLTGGEDINPKLLGEERLNASVKWDDARDEFEMKLFKAFLDKNKPIFGICRGFQVINVALGGGLYQDLVEQRGLVHMNTEIRHPITTKEGSLLYRLFGESFRVNSTHHQAVRELGEGLEATAWSVEGICEGFEHGSKPIFGTQFHPERLTNIMWDDRTPDFAPLFEHFTALCAGRV